jgi:leucyl aminopeptidase
MRNAVNIVPKADFPRFFRTATKKSAAWLNQIESLIAFVDTAHIAQLDHWPHGGDIRRAISERPHAAGSVIQCMLPGAHPILLIAGILSSESTPYADLTLAARLIKAVAPFRPSQVGILAAVEASRATRATDALVSALLAATEEHPAAKREPTPRWRPKAIRLTSAAPSHTVAVEQGAHTARWLTMLPPNVLYPGSYRKAVDAMARKWGWSVETFDERRLRRLGAGAFLAVSAGSARRDAAIVRISYRPKNSARRQAPIALVGKGLCFDTGGHNLKSAGSMLNMHADMAGSAVALGTLISLSEARHPYPVDVWLALAENRIGPDAYTQQDVIKALDGTSIQIVHTDAEGRMVLADTLALVARSRPAAVVDFATLTGACVSALTERLSGFFTNVPTLRDVVEAAGHDSGERMHGFPMPDDFDEDLDSPTADVSQCLIGGKGDHIYAARFLSRFIPKGLPWVHCDLSSAERTGGLAHVPHTITGFGVRFAVTLLESAAFRQAIDTKESRS